MNYRAFSRIVARLNFKSTNACRVLKFLNKCKFRRVFWNQYVFIRSLSQRRVLAMRAAFQFAASLSPATSTQEKAPLNLLRNKFLLKSTRVASPARAIQVKARNQSVRTPTNFSSNLQIQNWLTKSLVQDLKPKLLSV